jgi:hypothetical protein
MSIVPSRRQSMNVALRADKYGRTRSAMVRGISGIPSKRSVPTSRTDGGAANAVDAINKRRKRIGASYARNIAAAIRVSRAMEILAAIAAVLFAPVAVIIMIVFTALTISARVQLRRLPPRRGTPLIVQVDFDGAWLFDGLLVSVDGPKRIWTESRRIRRRPPSGTTLEVWGVAQTKWIGGDYRQAERCVVIEPPLDHDTVEIFLGSRAAFERTLASYQFVRPIVLAAVAILLAGVAAWYLSTVFGSW